MDRPSENLQSSSSQETNAVADADPAETSPIQLNATTSPLQANSRRERYTIGAVCGLLGLAVLLAFGRSVTYGFINWDDAEYVYENPHVLHGVSVDEVAWALTHSHTGFWLPLVWISYMVDNQFYGSWIGGYHLTNVLLHMATAIGLFLVLRSMTGDIWPSAFAAALFAIHPLRVESVVWVTERKDVLNGLFFVLALATYKAYAARPFALWRYLMVVAFFILSLMAKPMTVTLPVVLLLLDVWPLKRISWNDTHWWYSCRVLMMEKIPLFLVSAIFSVLTLHNAKSVMSPEQIAWVVRIENVLICYSVFLGELVWPVGLAPVYPDMSVLPSVLMVAVAVVILLLISWRVVAARREHTYLLIGWLWYLVMLFPVSGILKPGAELRPDRLAYLPHIGLAMAIAWGTVSLVRRFPSYQRFGVLMVSLTLGGLLVGTIWQTGFWADHETFWNRSLAITPRNAFAHTQIGVIRYNAGHIPEAMKLFELALQVHPSLDRAHYNYGVALFKLGHTARAIDHYRQAILSNPNNANAHNNLGNALATMGDFVGAIKECRAALKIEPDYAEAHFNLGNSLAMSGQSDEAIKHFQLAIRNKRDYATAYCNCGNTLLDLNRIPEAINYYREAIRIKPDYAAAHNNLGESLLKTNRTDEAIEHCKKSIQIKPDFAAAHFNLGLCLDKGGRRDEALASLEESLRLAQAAGHKPMIQAIQIEIQQVRDGKP